MASLLMWGSLIIVAFLMTWDNAASFHARFTFLTVNITVGLATFLISSRFLKNQEMMMLINALKRIKVRTKTLT